MPQYFAPGVYVEEVSSGAKPIAGVGTSIAGFIGVVANDVAMPGQPGQFQKDSGGKLVPIPYTVARAGEPQLITSWESFKNRFGDFQAGNLLLAHAVYGFFNNGGTRCWIIRVAPGAAPAPKQPAAPQETGAPQATTSGRRATKASSEQPGSSAAASQAATATLVAAAAPTTNGDLQRKEQAVQQALTAVATVETSALTDALDAFKAIDEIAIVAIPGAVSDEAQTAILDHCENEFLQDRFAILDGRLTTTLTKDDIQGGVRDSTYAAIYYPWIRVSDPFSGGIIAVPPCGHIAGVYARVDAERGVHKAPANEVIRGALDVTTLVSREDQAGLNPEDINVIRKFGGNITIFGARTLKGKEDPEWKYINIRRLFLFLRESIDEGTQWVVFEPNDAALWGKIRRNITAFLTNVWRSGALFGATPQEAFFVRCDETTNPNEVRALGQVVTEIGVAVVAPAEFVIFRVSQWAGPAGQ